MRFSALLVIPFVALATLVHGQPGLYSQMVNDYYISTPRPIHGDFDLEYELRNLEDQIGRLDQHTNRYLRGAPGALVNRYRGGAISGITLEEKARAIAAEMDRS